MPQNLSGIACLTLAAGAGSRLGGGKLLLPWKGKPLIVHVLEKALRIPTLLSMTFVTGHAAASVRGVLEEAFPPDPPFPLRVIRNKDWKEGLSSSLQRGVRLLLKGREAKCMRGVLILLGDQPLVREKTLRDLCAAHNKSFERNPNHAATVPTYGGVRGNPVILSPSLFPSLFLLRGDCGARSLFNSLGKDILFTPVRDKGVLHDVDSPEDYAALPENL